MKSEDVKKAIEKVYQTRKDTCGAEWIDFANELEKELGLKY